MLPEAKPEKRRGDAHDLVEELMEWAEEPER